MKYFHRCAHCDYFLHVSRTYPTLRESRYRAFSRRWAFRPYMLRFIDDESYRRRILVQLNRGEGRHQLVRTVFHGKRGELRQRYREGQEDQLGALGLVVNLVVLWNTIYIDAALDQLRADGHAVLDDDVARLSPLGSKHINMLGRYAFTIPDMVARGELRPLRDPSTTGTDDD